jgi:hypothetical protein
MIKGMEDTIKRKMGQVYVDKDGNMWVYRVAGRKYDPNSKSRYTSYVNDPETGRYLPLEKSSSGSGNMMLSGDLKTIRNEDLTFVADNKTALKKAAEGVDVKLIKTLSGMVKIVESYEHNTEYTWDSIVNRLIGMRHMPAVFAKDVIDKDLLKLKMYSVRNVMSMRSSDFEEKVATPLINANDKTILELRKVFGKAYRISQRLLSSYSVKENYIEEQIGRYYREEEAEFLRSLTRAHGISSKIDLIKDGFNVDKVEVKVKCDESGMGNIVYWHYRNVGSAVINGERYEGEYYSSKSHGWNYDN